MERLGTMWFMAKAWFQFGPRFGFSSVVPCGSRATGFRASQLSQLSRRVDTGNRLRTVRGVRTAAVSHGQRAFIPLPASPHPSAQAASLGFCGPVTICPPRHPTEISRIQVIFTAAVIFLRTMPRSFSGASVARWASETFPFPGCPHWSRLGGETVLPVQCEYLRVQITNVYQSIKNK